MWNQTLALAIKSLMVKILKINVLTKKSQMKIVYKIYVLSKSLYIYNILYL